MFIRIILLLLVSMFFVNCNSSLKNERDYLKYQNDSLKIILKELSNKYIFDSISFRDIYSKNNTKKLNSNYEIELLVVGYNSNKNFFVKYDSIDSKGKLINPVPLPMVNGGFKYNTVLKKKITPIKIQMNINSEFGKSRSGNLYEKVIARGGNDTD